MKTQSYLMSGISVWGKLEWNRGKKRKNLSLYCVPNSSHTHTHTQSLSTNPFEVGTWNLTSPAVPPRPQGERSLALWSKSTWAAALESESYLSDLKALEFQG